MKPFLYGSLIALILTMAINVMLIRITVNEIKTRLNDLTRIEELREKAIIYRINQLKNKG